MEQAKKERPKMPARSITVTIGGVDFEIKLPNTGQEIDIESKKDYLTQGAYKNMLYADPASQNAYFSASAIATFETLIPSLSKQLNVDSLQKLDRMEFKSVREAYMKYLKWIREWDEYVNYEEPKQDGNKDE